MGSVLPDKDGVFTLKNVRRGQYAFSPRFFGRYWYLKSMLIPSMMQQPNSAKQAPQIKDVAKNWTLIKSGDRLTGLTITLAEGGASIRGQLTTGEDQKPQTGLNLYLVSSERDKLDDPLRYFTQPIAADGAFSLTSVPPGRYWILTQQPQPDSPTSTEKLRQPDAVDARAKIRR